MDNVRKVSYVMHTCLPTHAPLPVAFMLIHALYTCPVVVYPVCGETYLKSNTNIHNNNIVRKVFFSAQVGLMPFPRDKFRLTVVLASPNSQRVGTDQNGTTTTTIIITGAACALHRGGQGAVGGGATDGSGGGDRGA